MSSQEDEKEIVDVKQNPNEKIIYHQLILTWVIT